MFFPNNRDALLQKGGSSDKVQRFRDDKLNDLLTGISAAVEPQQRLQLTGDAQRYLIDNAYVILFSKSRRCSPARRGSKASASRPSVVRRSTARGWTSTKRPVMSAYLLRRFGQAAGPVGGLYPHLFLLQVLPGMRC